MNLFQFVTLAILIQASFSEIKWDDVSSSDNDDTLLNYKVFFLIMILNVSGLMGGVSCFIPWPILILFFSLTFWLGIMIFSVYKDWRVLASHFTPSKLSIVGSVPMTFIEMMGILIRPLTLGMRLCANIVGGHLIGELMEEMGGGLISLTLLHSYETFVCMMQALIFVLLLLNYFKETK